MYQRLLSCLVLIAALTAHAQDINIRGKVTNSTGEAVAGAIVELMNEGIQDTTGADGVYLITDATGVIARSLLPQTEIIVLVKGMLKVNLTEPAPVTITIMNIDGSLVKKEMYRNLQPGYYRLNIADASRASKLLVINASIGNRTTTFRYFSLQNSAYATNSSGMQSVSDGAKMAAVVNDTLKVTAEGYAVKNVAVTSYNQEVNVTLEKEVAGDVIAVRLDQERQLIRGFGINNTWKNIGSAIPKCFDSTSGLGMNILRVGMQPNATNVSAYQSFDDVKDAARLGCKYFIGTVWSAPAHMKTNNDLNRGGYLKEEYYQEWAEAIAKFPSVFKAGSGIDLYAMSPQNETDFASCAAKGPPCTVDYVTMIWTGKMYAKFFEIVGPLIKAAGCKAMAPEASEWIHAWSDFSGYGAEIPGDPTNLGSSDPLGCGYIGVDDQPKCDHENGYDYGHWLYANKKAWDAIDIFSTHQYDTQVAEPWPADVSRTNANGIIEVWQTEMSGVRYWPEQGDISGTNCTCSSHIQNGVAVARWIHSALTVGEASAWCYWWWQVSGDNEGVICNGNALTKRYYTIGNYSRYMRPGQHVVNISGTDLLPEKVLLVASKSDNGKVVIVAVNETTSAQSIPITITGGTVPASFKPIVTADGNKNWAEGSNVSVNNNALTANLEAMSVTTFVSQ